MATSPIYSWPEPDNTDLVKNGALAIRTLGNAIDTTMGTMVAKTIIDAKGDLIAGTAADTAQRLAVGNNGETLVADSSATTGLRYTGNYAAGKNVIQNGDFYINQRGFTSTTSSTIFIYDRWKTGSAGGTSTYSAQTFTPGTAPVAGYEGKNYLRIVTTGQSAASDYTNVFERIEGVRTLAGQTATVSFWAKANTGTPKIGTTFLQLFGSGGSPSSAVVVNGQSATISTSWARYSFTFSVPSISGKTIGTAGDDSVQFEIFVSAGADFATRSGTVGLQSNTFEIWGVQVEAGSVATAFQTATGTIQGELAACQRYYWTAASGTSYTLCPAFYYNASYAQGIIPFPVTMRTAPSLIATSGTNYYFIAANGSADYLNSLTIMRASTSAASLTNTTEASGVQGYAGELATNNASTSVAFSAEL
jgi:hypothetical protein